MDTNSINYRLFEAVNNDDLELAEKCLIDGANPCHQFNDIPGYTDYCPTTAFEEAFCTDARAIAGDFPARPSRRENRHCT